MGVKLILAEPDDDGIWDTHVPAFQAFQVVAGQWRTQVVTITAMGTTATRVLWIGLDYAAARSGLELAGIAITPDLWSEVRDIETGAIEELNRGR